MRKVLAGLALLSLLAVPAFVQAQNAPVSAAASAAQMAPASKMIQDLGNQAIAIAADKSLSQDARRAKYDELLRASFDLTTIGHFVLGRYWTTVAPEKQQEFLKTFETLIIKIYTSRINFYSGEGFKVKSERAEDERDTVVNSEITHPDGSKSTNVDWRVRSAGGKLTIVDVSIEGVSQSVTERQEYASVMQQNNGNIEPLLTLMRQQISGQAPAAVSTP